MKIKRLNRDQLVDLVTRMMSGEPRTEAEGDEWLLTFALNSPDPAKAMDLLLEPGGPESPATIVDEAMSYSRRDPTALPPSELHPNHPLRRLQIEP